MAPGPCIAEMIELNQSVFVSGRYKSYKSYKNYKNWSRKFSPPTLRDVGGDGRNLSTDI